jgi:carboxymethylenebutenolidase
VPDDYAGLQAAVLAHFGEEDAFVPIAAADDLAAKIKAGNGQTPEIIRYPAGHAFVNNDNLLGTHDAEQAAKAWDRTVAFLHEHLG